MSKKRIFKELRDAYRFRYFTPSKQVHGVFGDPYTAVVTLSRRQKKHNVAVVASGSGKTALGRLALFEIFAVVAGGCISKLRFVVLPVLFVVG